MIAQNLTNKHQRITRKKKKKIVKNFNTNTQNKEIVAYANIFLNGDFNLFRNKYSADIMSTNINNESRIACIKLTGTYKG